MWTGCLPGRLQDLLQSEARRSRSALSSPSQTPSYQPCCCPGVSCPVNARAHLHDLPREVQNAAGSSSQEAPQPCAGPVSHGPGLQPACCLQTLLLPAGKALSGLQLPLLLVEPEPDQPLFLGQMRDKSRGDRTPSMTTDMHSFPVPTSSGSRPSPCPARLGRPRGRQHTRVGLTGVCSLRPPTSPDALRLLTWVVPRAGGCPRISCQDTVSPKSCESSWLSQRTRFLFVATGTAV